MKYTIYEDPLTHRFAFLPLPNRFADGDKLPVVATDRWFATRDEAVAALPELLNLEEARGDESARVAQLDRARGC
jgi:hypothetical protein